MLSYALIVIFLSNLLVGVLLGMSSIGGFLLPLVYVGVLQFSLSTSLALSFISFAAAGAIGAYFYWKSGNLDVRLAALLSIGSLFGAFAGVQFNVWIPEHIAKLVMYIVILLSGASLFIRRKQQPGVDETDALQRNLLHYKTFVVAFGFFTAAICSLTGAGGPILVIPLLTFLGLHVRIAVGVGLLNSVIIALPSAFGYLGHAQFANIGNPALVIVLSLAGQIIGIFVGSLISKRVNMNHLKVFISSITIVSSIYMIVTVLV